MQQFFPQNFRRPGGQNRPAELAPGVGQSRLDGVEAIKPLPPRQAVPVILGSFRPARLVSRLGPGLGTLLETCLEAGLASGLSSRVGPAPFRLFLRITAGFFEAGTAVFAEIPFGVFVAHGALIKKCGQG